MRWCNILVRVRVRVIRVFTRGPASTMSSWFSAFRKSSVLSTYLLVILVFHLRIRSTICLELHFANTRSWLPCTSIAAFRWSPIRSIMRRIRRLVVHNWLMLVEKVRTVKKKDGCLQILLVLVTEVCYSSYTNMYLYVVLVDCIFGYFFTMPRGNVYHAEQF